MAFWFAPQVARVVGVDILPEMVNAARRFASEQGIKNVSFTVLDDETSFPDGFFDLVNCVEVLKYILTDAGIKETIAEFCRVIKPGGCVAIIEQVNRQGDFLNQDEGYYRGKALYRTPEFYIEMFGDGGMHLGYHAITSASPLFWAYSRVQRALYGSATPLPAPGLQWVTAASVRIDLLTGRAMRFRNGHHFFLFRKDGEV